MPTPFDPSKLDLDISGNPESEKPEDSQNTPAQEPENTTEPQPETSEQAQETPSVDPLSETTQTDPLSESPEVELVEVETPEQSESHLSDSSVPEQQETGEDKDRLATTDDSETTQESETQQETPSSDDTVSEDDSSAHATATTDPLNTAETQEKITDINIASITDIAHLLIDEKYDFVTLEPEDNQVKVTFRKDGTTDVVKYIKYPTYSNILLKIKQIAHLPSDPSDKDIEGKWAIQIWDKKYDTLVKLAPGGFGEKIFLKLKESTDKKAVKQTKKIWLGKIFGFLWAILFICLVLGGMFITFIILNAQTVEDVRFFSSLGINLNDINTFIWRVVTFIFSLLLFIETVVLAIFMFKTLLTKKIFKKKKVVYGMISVILFIITFASASAWMIVDGKIKSLPNWQELAYGNIQLYDNDRLVSEAFDKWGSLISDSGNLIWPITVKYDLEVFANNEAKKWFTIKKYIWNIAGEKIEELNPILIKEFAEKWNYEVSLIVVEEDLKWDTIEKAVDNVPSLSVTHVVEVDEEITKNWGKVVKFDGEDLKQLGKLEWYFSDDLETPVHTGYSFKPAEVFFEETVIIMNVVNEDIDEPIMKVFVVGWEKSADIKWEIIYERSPQDNLEYTLSVKDAETSFWDGFIEEFEWIIGEKSIIKQADPTDLEKSSKIDFAFKSYGDNQVSVILKDASGKTSEITTVINIPRSLELKRNMDIFVDDEKIDARYIAKWNEYFVDDLWIPTTLKLDARFVRATSHLYSLKEVSWDFDNNQSIDARGKTADYDVLTEGNKTVLVNYKFVRRNDPDDIINMEEYIYIEWVRKEAIVDFKIEKDTDYVPVMVRFDASKSTIKNDDVVKFEYDYGDGIVEIRDAINPGHKYTEAWDYTIKLTITGRSWKKYSAEKKLVLKPEPQDVEIGVSIKNAPIGQGIDFSSDGSDGQITQYFWDFGDGNTSIEANPTHAYDREWTYTVKLKVDFENKNTLVDEAEIQIYEE